MLIHGSEHGNEYGCSYSIKFRNIVIVIQLVWEEGFFSYNKDDIGEILDNSENISLEMKLAIYQYIEKTNQLFFVSYKERH